MKTIIFMGTPQFAVPVLKGLIANDQYKVIATVTQPDRAVGRKHVMTASPVKQAALEAGIKSINRKNLVVVMNWLP